MVVLTTLVVLTKGVRKMRQAKVFTTEQIIGKPHEAERIALACLWAEPNSLEVLP